MAKTLLIESAAGPLDESRRLQALTNLDKVATTAQLQKLVKLANDPSMIQLLDSM